MEGSRNPVEKNDGRMMMDSAQIDNDEFLRIHFASHALAGILASVNLTVREVDPKMAEQIAANAFALADAMVEKRNRDKPATRKKTVF
jgi:hypothetical protein